MIGQTGSAAVVSYILTMRSSRTLERVIVLDDELIDIATAVVSDVLASFTLALEAQQVQARAHPRPRVRRRDRARRGHDHRRS